MEDSGYLFEEMDLFGGYETVYDDDEEEI